MVIIFFTVQVVLKTNPWGGYFGINISGLYFKHMTIIMSGTCGLPYKHISIMYHICSLGV